MTKKKFTVTIDGKNVTAEEGQTILSVARENNIDIPVLCYHPDLREKASCRICVVEVEGIPGLIPSCSSTVREGKAIFTASEKVLRARKIALELIYAQHVKECNDCIIQPRCQLLSLARKNEVPVARFKDRKINYPIHQFGPAVLFDSTKCIDCRNCVEICQEQGIGFLELEERDTFYQVVPSKDPKKDCIYCGQCIVHCPVGALEGVGEFEEIEEPLKDKSKTVVFQFAPSIRSSIGEEFDMPYGSVVTDKLVGAIKALGADKVFDVSVGADFTTLAEADELIERLEKKEGIPMFTSCCPAWVKYVEFYRPDLIPNLTTVRSPHMILGKIIKTFWAERMALSPKDIIVVSVMPCVSKKYEITRPEFTEDGIRPVDYVLTTRELAHLLRRKKIDLRTTAPQPADQPWGIPSGAGVIYGASGGVMESALRTAYHKLTGRNLGKLDLTNVRGLQGTKKAAITIGKTTLRVAVVNGIKNAIAMLDELKQDPRAYDYVEVMSCLGGCIGGGGQPVPTSEAIRQKRAKALYDIDAQKHIWAAHENPVVTKIYERLNRETANPQRMFFTSYTKKEKEVIIQ